MILFSKMYIGMLAVAFLFVTTYAEAKTIDFPCTKNLLDGDVQVDGLKWEQKMRSLGFTADNEKYVGYEVLSFKKKKVIDETWVDGVCKFKLQPVNQ